MSMLERDCVRQMQAAGAALAVSARVTASRDWASALFTGTRLTLDLAVDDDGDLFDQWLADLPERELSLRGHFVADAEVTGRSANAATIEILAIEEA